MKVRVRGHTASVPVYQECKPKMKTPFRVMVMLVVRIVKRVGEDGTSQGKARQGKARKGKERQGKARHDTTRHEKTRHDTTRHDKIRQDTTRHDKTRLDKGFDRCRQSSCK